MGALQSRVRGNGGGADEPGVQREPLDSHETSATSRSTGREDCITRRKPRRAGSAISMVRLLNSNECGNTSLIKLLEQTSSWASSSSYATTRESSTSTLTCITAMESKRRFTRRIES
jgi:hypothetical protein